MLNSNGPDLRSSADRSWWDSLATKQSTVKLFANKYLDKKRDEILAAKQSNEKNKYEEQAQRAIREIFYQLSAKSGVRVTQVVVIFEDLTSEQIEIRKRKAPAINGSMFAA